MANKLSTVSPSSLSKDDLWSMTAFELMDRWGMDEFTIKQLILGHGLPVRDERTFVVYNLKSKVSIAGNRFLSSYLTEGPFDRWRFRPRDVRAFEEQHDGLINEIRNQGLQIRKMPGNQPMLGEADISLVPAIDENNQELKVVGENRATIPVPLGSSWEQISIRIVNEQRIEITTPEGTAPWTAKQLGFKNKRKLWPLLKFFAEKEGVLRPKSYEPIKANVSGLRKLLQGIFPSIDGSPIKDYSQQELLMKYYGLIVERKQGLDSEENPDGMVPMKRIIEEIWGSQRPGKLWNEDPKIETGDL